MKNPNKHPRYFFGPEIDSEGRMYHYESEDGKNWVKKLIAKFPPDEAQYKIEEPRIANPMKRKMWELFKSILSENSVSVSNEERKEWEEEWRAVQNLPENEQRKIIKLLAKDIIKAKLSLPPNFQHRFRTPKDSTEPSGDMFISLRSKCS